MKFLEWFIKDETQKKWAELGGYTASAKVLESPNSRTPRRTTRPSTRPCSR